MDPWWVNSLIKRKHWPSTISPPYPQISHPHSQLNTDQKYSAIIVQKVPKSKINLPLARNYLHSIYIVFTTIYMPYILYYLLEKEIATHSSVLAWSIPGTGEPGGLPSMGSHRVSHDWSDLAAAAAEILRHAILALTSRWWQSQQATFAAKKMHQFLQRATKTI